MKKTIVWFLAAALFAPAAVFATVESPFATTEQNIAALQAQILQLTQLLAQLIAQKNSTPSTTSVTCFVPTYDLYIGRTDAETSGEVKKLQLWLKAEGYFPDAQGTGYYGEKTAAAVMKWQKAHGMDFVTNKSGVGKQTRAKMQEACGKPVIAQCAKYNDPPVITSVTPSSGPVGTVIEIQGCNFLGFEGDKNFWLTDSKGVKGLLYGASDSATRTSNTLARVTLPQKLCQNDNSYSGLPCQAFQDLAPGAYTIYSNSWGGKSNTMNFTVTAQ